MNVRHPKSQEFVRRGEPSRLLSFLQDDADTLLFTPVEVLEPVF